MFPLRVGQRAASRECPPGGWVSEGPGNATRQEPGSSQHHARENLSITLTTLPCSVAMEIELRRSLVLTQAGSYHMHAIPEPLLSRLTLPHAHISLPILTPTGSSRRDPPIAAESGPRDTMLVAISCLDFLVPMHWSSFCQPSARHM